MRAMFWMLGATLFLAGACKVETYQPDEDEDDGGGPGGGTGADDTAGSGTDSGGTDACAELGPSECVAEPTCAPMVGRNLIPLGDSFCVDPDSEGTVVGCMSAETACDDVETLAAGPADPERCMWFTNSCIPGDWVTTGCEGIEYGICPEDGGADGGGT